eukprot:3498838-Lingulodinium_polyedra.AAC.1
MLTLLCPEISVETLKRCKTCVVDPTEKNKLTAPVSDLGRCATLRRARNIRLSTRSCRRASGALGAAAQSRTTSCETTRNASRTITTRIT